MVVPEVLSSGDHEKIRRWRRRKALEKTLRNRPDLLTRGPVLSKEDKDLLEEISSKQK
jgi:tRNA (guanine37-N1)-methyltransferase